jgi:hypothetical protein
MAVYKTISSKEIVRKVMRDLNPHSQNGDWLHDAIEWIGEALEHIGSSAQLITKVCTIEIKDHKASLPADLYYPQQVATSGHIQSQEIESEITELKNTVAQLVITYTQARESIANHIIASTDGTYTSTLTEDDIKEYNHISKISDHQIRDINSRIVVLENTLMGGETGEHLIPLKYCTNTFPESEPCPDCHHDSHIECYFIESDYIKTSFAKGTVCISYKALPTDPDCYPLVPDDISFKEAMFWYIYKKMLLGGTADMTKNGIQYNFADEKWKYYCTQARNAAVFPDIDRMESFMNQWVRLIPNINRHDHVFDELGDREDIYRGRYNTYGR